MSKKVVLTSNSVIEDPWRGLKAFTPARLALGRVGASLPTRAHLEFQLAHAQARDAVHSEADFDSLGIWLSRDLRQECVAVKSRAETRQSYLLSPELGRLLCDQSAEKLRQYASAEHSSPGSDVCIVLGDGLSSRALMSNGPTVVDGLLRGLRELGLTWSPLILARNTRVALADQIGEIFRSKLCLILLGERPGLSCAESLGAYITYQPRPGTPDSERNCISNIHPSGLPPLEAANEILKVMEQALNQKCTGVRLKR